MKRTNNEEENYHITVDVVEIKANYSLTGVRFLDFLGYGLIIMYFLNHTICLSKALSKR